MEQEEVVTFWLDGAKDDWDFATEIWKSGKRLYNALFFAQLSLEKTLKALHYHKKMDHPLMTHGLVLLSKKIGFPLDRRTETDLKKITSFNVTARYDDYKLRFRKEATGEFVGEWMKKSERIRRYLLSLFQ